MTISHRIKKMKKKNNNPPEIEWVSIGSGSGPNADEVLKNVTYYKNPPIIFNPKSSVKRLDVTITSNRSLDEELLHHLLQKTK